MVFIHNLLQRGTEITYQGTADTAGIHFLNFYARFLQESAVDTDFPELVFNQYHLASCQRFFQKLLN